MENEQARWAPADLVERAMTGNHSALDDLLAHVWPGCVRLSASLIGDRVLAEDAAQNACAAVITHVRGLRSAAAFDAWLYRIVVREASRVRRKHSAIAIERWTDLAPHRDETTALDVWRALGTLPPGVRDAVVLFYFDDLPTHAIGLILRVPHATVRTRLARARKTLRDLLDGYGDSALSASLEVSPNVS